MKKLNITMVVMSVCFFSSCSCSTSKGSQEPSIPAHTHYWNDPVWSWNEDNTEAKEQLEKNFKTFQDININIIMSKPLKRVMTKLK